MVDPADFVQRAASPVGDTASVPTGTMLTAPSVQPTGPAGTAPVVAVNTSHWYSDPTMWATLGGALLALEPVVEQALTAQTFNWRSFALSCILALAAYFRNKTNTVIK